MLVVADSSPIIVLVNIGHVDVLPALFNEVLIPPQVGAELTLAKRPEAVRRLMATPPSWLLIRGPTAIEQIAKLHEGECAAISLARELGADLLLIDEMAGRKAALERQIAITGTIGVLELAADRGLVDLSKTFDLIRQTDFWVSPKLLDARLKAFHSRKSSQR